MAFVSDYQSRMVEAVFSHEGTLDKFIGDAVMATFGTPTARPEATRQAVDAAIAMRSALAELNRERAAAGKSEIQHGIGIHCGPAVVGNVGTEDRLEYTVMGDTVNLASRLEGANKIYGTRILVSEATVALCREDLSFREIDLVRVAGRETPVRIFQPLGQAGAAPVATATKLGAADLERFAEACAAFRAGRFAQAEQVFQALATHDPVAAHFAARALAHVASPPPGDWDGVTNLAKT